MSIAAEPNIIESNVGEEISKNWKDSESLENNEEEKKTVSLKVLDPDDPLMKRFQEALKSHLLRVNEKLTVEIAELQAVNKEASKKREEKGIEMYEAQREISRLQSSIEKYSTSLEDLKKSREEKEHRLKEKKDIRNKIRQEADDSRKKTENLARELECLSFQCKHYGEFEKEIANHLTIAKRMSEKDAAVQKELIRQKQQEDYIILKLNENIWKLENEIWDLKKQKELKMEDKLLIEQTVTDADADLGALQRERNSLMAAWNRVVANILQRDKITEDLSAERTKIRESFKTLQTRIDKTKKDTLREMENNETFTGFQSKIEEDIRCNQTTIGIEKDKADVLEYKILDVTKMLEKTEADFDIHSSELQSLRSEEKKLDKELEKLGNQKTMLEDELLLKLSDKMTHDKSAMHLKKIVRELKETVNQLELTMLQTENQYGKNLFELERIKNFVAAEKQNLEDLVKGNTMKERELNKIKLEIDRCNLGIEKKQKIIGDLNRKIEEMKTLGGTIDMSTQDIKITSLEKRIEEIDKKNEECQKFWLRQEGNMVSLSQQRNSQLEELNRLSRQITIMEQKNLKLEYALENEKKEEDKIDRRMKELRQRLIRTNAALAERNELRNNLLDKNFITQDEYVKKLKEAEVELVRYKNEIKQLEDEKISLEEKLCLIHREYFSWEKKMKLAAETSKIIKEEHATGGDIAMMKSEIHKMEIRLSHLRKAQEKMIRDMEFCIARRDVIIDGALAKEKRNPKGLHNKKVMLEKRMDDRRMKIKQVIRETKCVQNKIVELSDAQTKIQSEINENTKVLKTYQDSLPDIQRQISEGEVLKHHKLECLVRKQRKVRMLQKVREGKYKMSIKSETLLNDELEKQRNIKNNLIEVMEETDRDFPHLKEDIKKILLTIQEAA